MDASWQMVVALAVAWAIRELVPVLRSRLATPAPTPNKATPSSADASGGYALPVGEGLATRRELEALATLVDDLRGKVAELDKFVAVLKERIGGE